MNIKVSDLPVSCPILSVRRIAEEGNDIVCRIDVEREGVYFIKMKIMGAVSRGGE